MRAGVSSTAGSGAPWSEPGPARSPRVPRRWCRRIPSCRAGSLQAGVSEHIVVAVAGNPCFIVRGRQQHLAITHPRHRRGRQGGELRLPTEPCPPWVKPAQLEHRERQRLPFRAAAAGLAVGSAHQRVGIEFDIDMAERRGRDRQFRSGQNLEHARPVPRCPGATASTTLPAAASAAPKVASPGAGSEKGPENRSPRPLQPSAVEPVRHAGCGPRASVRARRHSPHRRQR